MIILLLFAFCAGIITILTPCIWPLLPIVLSAGTAGRKFNPFGIVGGIVISFSLATLFLSSILRIFPIDPDILRLISIIIIGFMGLTLLIPSLAAIFERGLASLNINPVGSNGFVTGLALGLVWSPCAGPILATIATLAATQQLSLRLIAITVSYTMGIGVPLFILAVSGQKLFGRLKTLSAYTGRIQQIFGVIILLTALAIATNLDRTIQTKLLNYFPNYSQIVTNFENQPFIKQQLHNLQNNYQNYGMAPEFRGITRWLNSEPLTMKQLRGKVVLVDFWTYTCINCIRTLPYVVAWYNNYKDQGLIVIGVHTPEFEFEKKTENVLKAIQQYHITYPVAQDNNYATWQAFANQYWPAKYLIDKEGNIRYSHFGEGEYAATENKIRELLNMPAITIPTAEISRVRLTPETYLGQKRGGESWVKLTGDWQTTDEYIQAGQNSVLDLDFYAGKVFLVITPAKAGDVIKVSLDNQPRPDVVLDVARLYDIVNLTTPDQHKLQLTVPPGTQLFAFTFGG